METTTAYLCPVCDVELVRVIDASTDSIDPVLDWAGPDLGYGPAIQRAVTRHHQEVDRLLRAAVDEHRCARPLRWRRWKRKHREELAAVAA